MILPRGHPNRFFFARFYRRPLRSSLAAALPAKAAAWKLVFHAPEDNPSPGHDLPFGETSAAKALVEQANHVKGFGCMGTAGIGTVGLFEAIDAFFPLIPIFLSLGTSHELVIGGMGLFEMPGGSGFLGGDAVFPNRDSWALAFGV
jgi:hypothetical protein